MKWNSWLKRPRWERQMHAEFQSHLENQVSDYMQKGLTREDAELRARREFGALNLAKEECRDQRAFEPLGRLLRDLRHASRSLRKTPSYAAAAILTLALGIGANTAIFSALDGVLLKPLPYREPDRLVIVALYNRSLKYPTYLSYPDFLDWQRDAHSFQQMAAFRPVGFDLTNPGSPEHIAGYEVSSGFFGTLGANLALGHSFSSNEDRIGGMPAAVIGHRLWQERFHRNPAVIGKSITLNGTGYTIVGVLPPAFRFEDQPADVFTPIGRADPFFHNDRTVHTMLCLARLAPAVALGEARAEMNTLQEHIDELHPTTEKGQGTFIIPLKQELVGGAGAMLLLLLGAVGFVLLIACANVANLLLARSAARTREFAVRRALGASRMQIIRQLITESVLLALVGGAFGLAVAKFGLSAVLAAVPGSLPRVEDIGVSASVLLFALGVSTVVGMLFGLVPALKHANSDLQSGLREGGRGSTAGHRRTQGVLAVVQIALALVLLSGAGLLFRTIRNLWAVNPGYQTQHVITFQVGLSPSVTETASSTRTAYRQLTARLREIPGVESADLTALLPLGRGDNSGPFWLGGHQPASMAEIPRATYYPAGPDYPRTMQISLLRGRFLTEADNIHAPLVCLIDSLLARAYFPHGDALGQTITIPHWGAAGAVNARIVGVVGHVEQHGMDGSAGEQPQIYYSFYQLPDEGLPIFRNGVTFAARTSLNPAAVLPPIKSAVYGAGGDQPVYNVRTMRDLVSGSMARQRFPMILLVAFAVLALLLATIGIYGVISYSTAQRVPEIGIRMALGAARWDVLQMLIGQGMRLALMGVAIGAVAAIALTRVLSSFSHLLYGVRATDPLTFAAVSGCLIAAVLLACYIPARRASQLDPMAALRHD
ncbi:MAG TPA: ABC transporter permease [Bryobacteraceae bacterium]|nr:ABC transporter permease [Bryobacteraceae bacterium]